MRSYPLNSPEAAARLVALVLISDGHVCRSEIEALERLHIDRELGLAPGALAQVMHTLCEDLLASAYGSSTLMCSVDDAALASLLAEVDDPALQRTVLRLAQAAAEADRHMAESETLVMAAARRHWQVEDTDRASTRGLSPPLGFARSPSPAAPGDGAGRGASGSHESLP